MNGGVLYVSEVQDADMRGSIRMSVIWKSRMGVRQFGTWGTDEAGVEREEWRVSERRTIASMKSKDKNSPIAKPP